MHRWLLLPLLLIAVGSAAQNTKRGFKFLEKLEYEKSAGIFKEVLAEKKDDPAARFGLAMVYADDSSSLFNLVEAWDLASHCRANLQQLDPETLEYIGEYFHNTEVRPRNYPVKKKIENAIDAVEAKLIKYVREENNLTLVYEVLDRFPDFRYHDNVMHIRNQLEFRKYEKQNTLEGYIEFIQKFPDAAQVDKAIRYRNQLAYQKAEQVNTPEAYREFMKTYPQAQECNLAVRKLNAAAFKEARDKNSIQAMEEFIARYPGALEVADARKALKQMLYDYALKIHTLEAYNEFIRKYPEGSQYVDIFNLRAADKGSSAVKELQDTHLQWARSFGSDATVQLSSAMTYDSLNHYIAGGTILKSDTSYSDIWIIKTDNDGQMLWNKIFGEQYNDALKFLNYSRHNNIVGVGYTWPGQDSASKESWMFRLHEDGSIAWSKKLGHFEINSLVNPSDGNLVLGGYQHTDSTGEHYALQALNENGKHLWERQYSGSGRVMKLILLNDKNILVAGDHWRAKIDPHGYLLWDGLFTAGDSVVNAIQMPSGEIIYAAIRNHAKSILVKTTAENKPVFEKEWNAGDSLMTVRSIVPGNGPQVIILADHPSYQAISWINTTQGDVIRTMQLPGNLMITEIHKDLQGNLILAGYNGEIILIKSAGTEL